MDGSDCGQRGTQLPGMSCAKHAEPHGHTEAPAQTKPPPQSESRQQPFTGGLQTPFTHSAPLQSESFVQQVVELVHVPI